LFGRLATQGGNESAGIDTVLAAGIVYRVRAGDRAQGLGSLPLRLSCAWAMQVRECRRMAGRRAESSQAQVFYGHTPGYSISWQIPVPR
jgi:hypothetical protein